MLNDSYNCIKCDQKIIKLYVGLDNMWLGGTVDKIRPGYGSRLDGEEFIFAICDDCCENLINDKKVILDKNEK